MHFVPIRSLEGRPPMLSIRAIALNWSEPSSASIGKIFQSGMDLMRTFLQCRAWHLGSIRERSIQMEAMLQRKPVEEVVPPGPDNPLGRFALVTSIPGILIHETIWPRSVYRPESKSMAWAVVSFSSSLSLIAWFICIPLKKTGPVDWGKVIFVSPSFASVSMVLPWRSNLFTKCLYLLIISRG